MKLKFFFILTLFFTRPFNHQGSRISYIALYGGVFFFYFMPMFQGLVLTESGVTSNTSENEDL